jgi:hypothetical protein
MARSFSRSTFADPLSGNLNACLHSLVTVGKIQAVMKKRFRATAIRRIPDHP